MSNPILLANDKYYAELTQQYNPGDTTIYLTTPPDNVPTLIVCAKGTANETVFMVLNKTLNSVTGVTRVKGANVELLIQTPVTCLNNAEFINQYKSYLGISWRGDWANDVEYEIQDGVIYNGSGYQAIQAGTNHLPTDTDYWQLVMSKGDQGDQGVQGEPGIAIVDADSLIEATFIEDTTNINTYVGTFTEPLIAYTKGLKINLKVTNANTGASSLNIDSLGAKSIKKNVSEDTEADDIKAGQVIPLVYDGTNFQIVGGGGSATGATRIIRELVNETPNGVIVDFTIDNEPVTGSEEVFLNGILQNISGDNDYTISGDTITFTSAPETGSIILVNYSTTSVFESNANADTVDGYHLTDILSLLHPVGSIYMSVVSTNPATIFGFGTWSAWGVGSVPVGVDTAQTEFNTVEKTGGEKTHIITEAEMPSHRHWISSADRDDANMTGTGSNGQNYGLFADAGNYQNYDLNRSTGRYSAYAGSGDAHNNLQPYITCYMWKRIA